MRSPSEIEEAWRKGHIVPMAAPRSLTDILRRLRPRFRRNMPRGGRDRGDAGEPALVAPDRPNPPLTGGAAAPLETDDA